MTHVSRSVEGRQLAGLTPRVADCRVEYAGPRVVGQRHVPAVPTVPQLRTGTVPRPHHTGARPLRRRRQGNVSDVCTVSRVCSWAWAVLKARRPLAKSQTELSQAEHEH